mmetsp:Transcript_14902/g.13100  ORF Transcript_14902/g.13100 Transcript_14902/m.13100 type:complete len:100 (+) Transcript_14902:688-987(+)
MKPTYGIGKKINFRYHVPKKRTNKFQENFNRSIMKYKSKRTNDYILMGRVKNIQFPLDSSLQPKKPLTKIYQNGSFTILDSKNQSFYEKLHASFNQKLK